MKAVALGRHLLVAELFASLQGEGSSCGQQAAFVRLSLCNLSCPRCDTPYTWDWSRYDRRAETRRMATEEVAGWVLDLPVELVVVTGGEPLLQQARLVPLVAAVTAAGKRVEVETNGTIVPCADLVETVAGWNVSPKLASFADPDDARRRTNPEALAALAATGRAVFKFVASRVEALAQAGFETNKGSQQRLLEQCRALSARYGIVVRTGLRWDQAPEWLAHAAVVVVPSETETFGLVALEAMTGGTPVVCFDVGNLPSLVGPGGVIVPRHQAHTGLWHEAEQILADQVRYEQTSRAGYYQARDYRPAHVTDQLVKVVS